MLQLSLFVDQLFAPTS